MTDITDKIAALQNLTYWMKCRAERDLALEVLRHAEQLLTFEENGKRWCKLCQIPNGQHRGGCPAEPISAVLAACGGERSDGDSDA